MVKTSFRFGFLVILLLLGMMIGITMAERGIYNIAGINESNPKSFQVSQKDNQIEVMVFGESYKPNLSVNQSVNQPENQVINDSSNPPVNYPEKEIHVQKPKEHDINAVGELGNKIGSVLQVSTEKGLKILAKMID